MERSTWLLDAMIRRPLGMAAVAFAVTFAVFLPSVGFDFVDYDDRTYVVENEHLRDGLSVRNVAWAAASRGYADNWHPLTWVSLMEDVTAMRLWDRVRGWREDVRWGKWDYEKGRSDPWFLRLSRFMHLHNVLLHAANAALLVLLTCLMAGRENCMMAGIFALLWSLHPLRVEAVCWVSERKEVLCAFFMLLSLLLYVGSEGLRVKREELNGRSRFSTFNFSLFTYHLSLVAYAAAVAAKPVAVTLPAVIVAWDWIFGGRIRWLRSVPFVVLSFLTCLFTMQSQGMAMDVGSSVTVPARLSMIFVSPLVYISQTVWPFGLAALYEPTRQIDPIALIGGAGLCVSCVALCIAWLVRRIRRPVSSPVPAPSPLDLSVFAVAWLYVGLLPMLGVVKVGCQEHCDRYTYWVGCGACVILTLFASRILRAVRKTVSAKDWGDIRRIGPWCAVALILALGCLTGRQMSSWKDPVALYRRAMTQCRIPEFAHLLALHLAHREGRAGVDEGLALLRDCAAKHPCATANLNLADFKLRFCPEDPLVGKFGGKLYSEEELLIREAQALEPDSERAKAMMEIIEKARKEAQ